VKNGVCFLDGIGFAPGLSILACGDAIRKLDAADFAVLTGKGLIKEQGIVAPEDAIYGPLSTLFAADLKKRKINILETAETP
jgi:hypothetical protein